MASYYDSSDCQIVIGSDNRVTLQAKGSDSASSDPVSFTVDQLRETAKLGKEINTILATEPDKGMIETIKEHWRVWKNFPDFSEMETKTAFDTFRTEYNPWFNKECDTILSALRHKDDVVARANRLNPSDDNYHISQMVRADAQRKFDKEWLGFMTRFIACEDSMVTLLGTLSASDENNGPYYTSYGEDYSIGTQLLGQYVRLIVQGQVAKSLGKSADDDITVKSAFFPSWTHLAGAFETCNFKYAASMITADTTHRMLARVVRILAMLECHLTPAIMAELNEHSDDLKSKIRYDDEEIKAGDETFYQAVEYLKKIGQRFGFAPA